ncbi:MAG: DNA primase [Acidobacteria bacterium]|nr:DNA primase [Acidobacteriota bacterium]
MAESGDFKELVKQQADIVRIVGDYLALKKSGGQNYSGLCPFHQEKTPSFSVHATRQFYHCFGCGASGDVFSFVQKIENISFPEAVRLIAQKLNIPIPKQTYSSPAEARDARIRGALLDMHERACAFFQDQLHRPEGARAREYLSGRGVSEDAINTFRIGLAPDSGFLLRDRLKGEYDEELLKASGLFSWKEADAEKAGDPKAAAPASSKHASLYSKFRSRVMFPISNEQGRIVAFAGRTLETGDKAGPKYLNSPETPIYSKSRILYNLDRAKDAIRKLDYVILVEGQMDCISVFTAGFHNVIASSGTAFTEAQARLLARFTHNVIVNFDPDTAGVAAAERSLAMLVSEDFQVRVLSLETGFDPDLFIRRKGKGEYQRALMGAKKYFDYLIERAQAAYPARSAQAKVQALNFLLPHLQRVPQRITRDELANDIAQKLGIESAVLRQELKHAAAARTTAIKAPAEVQVTPAERILIRALAAFEVRDEEHTSDRSGEDSTPDLRRQAQFTVESENLHHGLATEALIAALVAADDQTDVMSLPISGSDRRLLATVLMHEHEELTLELLESALAALRKRQLEHRQQQIRAEINAAERRSDTSAISQLLQEKLRIDRALASH